MLSKQRKVSTSLDLSSSRLRRLTASTTALRAKELEYLVPTLRRLLVKIPLTSQGVIHVVGRINGALIVSYRSASTRSGWQDRRLQIATVAK